MVPTRYQRTIATSAAVRGIGYWGGQDVCVEFRPAEPDTGIVFVRTDLAGFPRIGATMGNCAPAALRTNLRSGVVAVDMVEHVMAGLAGLRIDNCEVWVDQQEMPGCDGSSLPFVDALDAAGIVEQRAARRQKLINRTIRLGNGPSWIEARPSWSEETILRYELDYGDGSPIGHQALEIVLSPESFRKELAASRTFVSQAEAVAFQAQGLGRRATYQDLLVFGPRGPIDNELRFADECVRHKLLDMVGDLALTGCDLVGCVFAYRSGHQLNVELAQAAVAQDGPLEGLKRCA
ncbi:MAG: UDP-3-O-[3-hydroxymyristoyl] N-acetylglucosamine deacetylase [Planctomycetes bacterium RBG_13_63_9]|nr:MAG: UDP-3-O-[3-hydroxymyristoyl] N-acetylglucosamine deacetylase [Planctomycetes bacterium RBG_13_63_9]